MKIIRNEAGTNYLPHGGEIKGMHLAGRENWPTLINDPKGEREETLIYHGPTILKGVLVSLNRQIFFEQIHLSLL